MVTEENLTPNNLSRVVIAIMERYQCSYSSAVKKLETLTLNIKCGEAIQSSLGLQAALLTIANAGPRAFWGGVHIEIDPKVRCILPIHTGQKLSEVLEGYNSKIGIVEKNLPSLFLGCNSDQEVDALEIICNGWQGGVVKPGNTVNFSETFDFPTSGVMAGALGLGLSFLSASGIYRSAMEKSIGISLWRPDLPWLESEAYGPRVSIYPKRLWLAGLGHLGQGYAWNLGLLPTPKYATTLWLQDYDNNVEANLGSGLLTTSPDIGIKKTRVTAKWLESIGYKTIITERAFNQHTRRVDEEPYVCLSGFDSLSPRLRLEQAGFDLILDCGLGGTLESFDQIILQVLPDRTRSAQNQWSKVKDIQIYHTSLEKSIKNKDRCGIIELAGHAISTSFVGAFAGAITIAEVLRGLHKGMKLKNLSFCFRGGDLIAGIEGNYSTEHSRNGSISLNN